MDMVNGMLAGAVEAVLCQTPNQVIAIKMIHDAGADPMDSLDVVANEGFACGEPLALVAAEGFARDDAVVALPRR